VTEAVPTSCIDDVLRKIGRNVVGFQKLEGMLKALSQTGRLAGSLEEVRSQHAKHTRRLCIMSFGQVVSKFFSVTFVDGQQTQSVSGPLAFEISLTIQGGEREELREMLEGLVDERNELIHTRLLEFDGRSEGDCAELEAFLDAQFHRMEPVMKKVAGLVVQMKDARAQIVEALDQELRGRNGQHDV